MRISFWRRKQTHERFSAILTGEDRLAALSWLTEIEQYVSAEWGSVALARMHPYGLQEYFPSLVIEPRGEAGEILELQVNDTLFGDVYVNFVHQALQFEIHDTLGTVKTKQFLARYLSQYQIPDIEREGRSSAFSDNYSAQQGGKEVASCTHNFLKNIEEDILRNHAKVARLRFYPDGLISSNPTFRITARNGLGAYVHVEVRPEGKVDLFCENSLFVADLLLSSEDDQQLLIVVVDSILRNGVLSRKMPVVLPKLWASKALVPRQILLRTGIEEGVRGGSFVVVGSYYD